jgi:hypothetical protein
VKEKRGEGKEKKAGNETGRQAGRTQESSSTRGAPTISELIQL